jgi:hypothetical protein
MDPELSPKCGWGMGRVPWSRSSLGILPPFITSSTLSFVPSLKYHAVHRDHSCKENGRHRFLTSSMSTNAASQNHVSSVQLDVVGWQKRPMYSLPALQSNECQCLMPHQPVPIHRIGALGHWSYLREHLAQNPHFTEEELEVRKDQDSLDQRKIWLQSQLQKSSPKFQPCKSQGSSISFSVVPLWAAHSLTLSHKFPEKNIGSILPIFIPKVWRSFTL